MDSSYFDEIYHPRTALEHLNEIYPYEVSHPPLGKLIMGIGIRAFGMTPFGWRFMGTLLGVLMLPILYIRTSLSALPVMRRYWTVCVSKVTSSHL